jgi:YegS/Rv2252/BmrU family lipid kinase
MNDDAMTGYPVPAKLGAVRRRLIVIYNPTAGRRRRRRMAEVIRLLEGRADIAHRRTTARGDAEAFARATPKGAVAVVAGGDGTANEVANGLLAAGGGEMAVIPLGTANVLAAELGILDMATAARAAAAGSVLACRPGLANGRGFLTMAGAGFDAHVVAGVSPRLKRLLGKGAYVAEMLRQLLRFSFPRYRVTIDNVVHEAASVIVARGHFYGGRFVVAPDARLEGDELHVCLFRRGGRLRTIGYALALGLGRLHRLADVEIVRGIRVTIEGPPGDPVQGDGELIGILPVEIELSPIVIGLLRPAWPSGYPCLASARRCVPGAPPDQT